MNKGKQVYLKANEIELVFEAIEMLFDDYEGQHPEQKALEKLLTKITKG